MTDYTPTIRPLPHPVLRLRLSNGRTAAEEFTADSPATLRAGAAAALERYVAAHPVEQSAVLELHARDGRGADDWAPPMRPLAREVPGAGGRPVRVLVSAELLERRPPDDWTEIWDWCVRAEAWGRAIRGLGSQVARDTYPPAEREDQDRD